MLVESINEKLLELDEEIKEKEIKERLVEVVRFYKGPDEIVSAEEYKKYASKELVLYKVGSGIKGLDSIIEGFRPGTVIIVSGPTKQGKTTFCQTLTTNFSRQGYKSLWFSFDTPPYELIERFPELPLFYLPKKNAPEKKIEWIEKKVIEGLVKFDTRMIFIDHLESLAGSAESSSNYANQLQLIARDLKEISMRWNVTIFLNHHIRQLAPGEQPNYSHLKNSSGPAQETDVTIMVWREKEKSQIFGIQYKDSSIISVQLHRRTGKTGAVRLTFKENSFTEEVYDEQGSRPF